MYVYKLAREERENHQAWKKCKWKSQVIEIAIWIFNTRNQKKNPFLSSGKKAPFSSFFFWIWMKNVKKRNPTEMMMMLMRWQRMNDWLTDYYDYYDWWRKRRQGGTFTFENLFFHHHHQHVIYKAKLWELNRKIKLTMSSPVVLIYTWNIILVYFSFFFVWLDFEWMVTMILLSIIIESYNQK